MIDTLGSENLFLSQRLADLERAVASMEPDIKSDAKRVQIQDGDPRAQPQGPPDVARTQDVRGPVDVQAQMSSLTEMVYQLSKLVEAQVGVSGASPPIASAQAHPPSVAAQHTTAIPTLRLKSASTSQVAQFTSSRQAPTHPQNPVTRVTLPHAESVVEAADASGGDAATGASDPASHEETVVRIKDRKDLALPLPPENAGQARGYVNQVLMAIGRLQKTTGDDLYLWAQDCLTSSEEQLRADKRFPRTTREIAAKLMKTCRKGKFGLLFQNMVEHERNIAGTMPNGRVMLRSIFKHFQLERDRIGVLGERNLLGLKLAGQSAADMEAFREKYNYILRAIPLFNHLIDEFEKCQVMKHRVEKARETAHDSHRRTCAWLWAKAKADEFDQDVKLKPAVRGTGKEAATSALPAETKKEKKKNKKGPRAG